MTETETMSKALHAYMGDEEIPPEYAAGYLRSWVKDAKDWALECHHSESSDRVTVFGPESYSPLTVQQLASKLMVHFVRCLPGSAALRQVARQYRVTQQGIEQLLRELAREEHPSERGWVHDENAAAAMGEEIELPTTMAYSMRGAMAPLAPRAPLSLRRSEAPELVQLADDAVNPLVALRARQAAAAGALGARLAGEPVVKANVSHACPMHGRTTSRGGFDGPIGRCICPKG